MGKLTILRQFEDHGGYICLVVAMDGREVILRAHSLVGTAAQRKGDGCELTILFRPAPAGTAPLHEPGRLLGEVA